MKNRINRSTLEKQLEIFLQQNSMTTFRLMLLNSMINFYRNQGITAEEARIATRARLKSMIATLQRPSALSEEKGE